MKLRRLTWTSSHAALVFWALLIGRHDEASSFMQPPARRVQVRGSSSGESVRQVSHLRTSTFIRFPSLLNERRTRGKDGSTGSVTQTKVQPSGAIRRPRIKTKTPPTSTETSATGDKGTNKKETEEEEEEEEEEKEEEVDVHQVSDATALLACRAYLVRRQRLGPWKKRQERRDRLMRSSLYRRGVESSSSPSPSSSFPLPEGEGGDHPTTDSEGPPSHIGYFWEDTSELKYYVSPRRRRSLSHRLTGPSHIQLEEDEFDEVRNRTVTGGVQMSVGVGYDEALEVGREDDSNVDIDDDGDSPAWEFASRPVTSEEEAAVDDLCDELDDDEFQADDGATEDAGLVVGGAGPFVGSFAYDDVPPLSYVRRSQAAKKSWSRPQFREEWYVARWGDKKKRAALRSNQGDADKEKLRRVSSTAPLPMEAVADMTEEEIAHAIRTYLSSKQKRRESRSRSKSPDVPPNSPDTPDRSTDVGGSTTAAATVPSATLESLYPTEQELIQRRMERSERAAKAYQTRLANRKEEMQAPATARKFNQRRRSARGSTGRAHGGSSDDDAVAVAATPGAALERIERRLDAGVVPFSSDVELALQPVKLSGRKPALRRILSECFGLRGKCVPPNGEPQLKPSSQLSFVTQASVEDLGAFCLSLIRQAEASA